MMILIIKQGGEPLCKYLTQITLYNHGKTGVVSCIDGSQFFHRYNDLDEHSKALYLCRRKKLI